MYLLDTSAILSADITIRANYGLEKKPIIEAFGDVDEFILLEANAKLSLEGINFNGGGSGGNTFKSVFNVSSDIDENDTIELEISSCQFNEFTNADGGYILNSTAPVVFSRLMVTDVQIFDVARQAFLFEGNSHADSLVFYNCTFANVGREVLLMDVANQGDAIASLNHCTIDSVGFSDAGYGAISLTNVDATIRNTLFTNSNTSASVLILRVRNKALIILYSGSGSRKCIGWCKNWQLNYSRSGAILYRQKQILFFIFACVAGIKLC